MSDALAELRAELERLKEASRAKGQFLAFMSHEIRTPLNVVILNLDFLKLTELDDEQREAVEAGSAAAGALLGVLGEILDLSKIEAGRLEVADETVAIRALLDDIAKIYDTVARERGLSFGVQIADTVPDDIRGDTGRVRQILMNLVGNAFKFTKQGGVLVLVETDEAQAKLTIKVVDSGPGFGHDVASKLFHAYVQGDNRMDGKRVQGTGLGLAISKSLVELMSGHIGCEAIAGQGAMFFVELPLPAAAPAARPLPPDPSRIALAGSSAPRGLSGLLARLGHRLVHTSDAADVTLLVDLPPENWLSLAKPRVMMVGSTAPSELMTAARAGASGILRRERIAEDLSPAISAALAISVRRAQTTGLGEIGRLEADLPVLIVEDDDMSRTVIGRQLSHLGLDHVACASADEALEKLMETPVSLILTDYTLPGMDGIDLARQVRADEVSGPRRRVPIIMLSGADSSEIELSAMGAELDGILSKPITFLDLASALSKHLGVKARAAAKPSAPPAPVAIDLQSFAAIVGISDRNMLVTLLGVFVDSFPKILERADEALAARDRETVRRQAHAARSAAGNAAARILYDLTVRLENEAPNADFDVLTELLAAARRAFEDAQKFIAGLKG